MIIGFTIPGIPQAQGSKNFSKAGYAYEANKNLAPWRRDAIACARDARPAGAPEGPIFTGPVQVTMVAFFPRPKGHYGSGRNAGVLKASGPTWHSTAPDADKIARALGDALTQSSLIQDDRLIVSWDISKVYGDPRMQVTVADAAPLLFDQPAAAAEELYYDDLLAGSQP